MLGQPLIEKRVVGPQQVEHAAILAHDAREEQRRFFDERLSQLLVEREDHRIGLDRLDVAQVQPLPREVGDERVGARIAQHPAHLRFEHDGIAQPAAAPPGRAVLRPGCCSTGRTTVATPARRR